MGLFRIGVCACIPTYKRTYTDTQTPKHISTQTQKHPNMHTHWNFARCMNHFSKRNIRICNMTYGPRNSKSARGACRMLTDFESKTLPSTRRIAWFTTDNVERVLNTICLRRTILYVHDTTPKLWVSGHARGINTGEDAKRPNVFAAFSQRTFGNGHAKYSSLFLKPDTWNDGRRNAEMRCMQCNSGHTRAWALWAHVPLWVLRGYPLPMLQSCLQ